MKAVDVGLVQARKEIRVVLEGDFVDADRRPLGPGEYSFTAPVRLSPVQADAAFLIEDVTIGVGFHWERPRRLRFRGGLNIVGTPNALTAINEVGLETYIESVISSEMSAASPAEFLKAHAVISRSWLAAQLANDDGGKLDGARELAGGEWEILRWYGREAHDGFDVCADDHCQRYQGIPESTPDSVRNAVAATAGQFLTFGDTICDTRFSKCCGGVTEVYRSAWDDRDVPCLKSVFDGPGAVPGVDEAWILSRPDANCGTSDVDLLERILPGFDLETKDFFRWRIDYTVDELSALVRARTGIDLGSVEALEPIERGPSGRIVRLRIRGNAGILTVGKELEIRRVLSDTHLYSSAFVVDRTAEGFRLSGAGWGHGVGLCQIGAAVLADRGAAHEAILAHYYPGSILTRSPG